MEPRRERLHEPVPEPGLAGAAGGMGQDRDEPSAGGEPPGGREDVAQRDGRILAGDARREGRVHQDHARHAPSSVEKVVDMLRVVARRALAEEELQEGGAEAVDLVQEDAWPRRCAPCGRAPRSRPRAPAPRRPRRWRRPWPPPGRRAGGWRIAAGGSALPTAASRSVSPPRRRRGAPAGCGDPRPPARPPGRRGSRRPAPRRRPGATTRRPPHRCRPRPPSGGPRRFSCRGGRRRCRRLSWPRRRSRSWRFIGDPFRGDELHTGKAPPFSFRRETAPPGSGW